MTTAISICGRGSIINATSLVGGRWSRCCLGRSIDRSSPNCQAFSPLRSCTLRCPCAPTHRHGTLNDPAVVRIQRRSSSRRGTAWALCGSWGSGGRKAADLGTRGASLVTRPGPSAPQRQPDPTRGAQRPDPSGRRDREPLSIRDLAAIQWGRRPAGHVYVGAAEVDPLRCC
jgi:hypothetical protein